MRLRNLCFLLPTILLLAAGCSLIPTNTPTNDTLISPEVPQTIKTNLSPTPFKTITQSIQPTVTSTPTATPTPEPTKRPDSVVSISLIGEPVMQITRLSEWVDPGFIASDTVDGDLTSSVTVSDTLNTSENAGFGVQLHRPSSKTHTFSRRKFQHSKPLV